MLSRHQLKTLLALLIGFICFALVVIPANGHGTARPLKPHTPIVVDGVRDAGYTLLATDPISDLADPGPGAWSGTAWSDLTQMYVADDGTYLYVYIDLPQYSRSGSSGSIGLAIDTGSGGGTGDPWGNAITFAYTSTYNNVGLTPTITTTTILPDVIVRGNLPGMSDPPNSNNGWTEWRQWNGSTWTGAGNNWGGISAGQQIGTNTAYADQQGVEIRLSYAQLGITAGQLVHLQFLGTQTSGAKGAFDTLPSDDQSTGWDDATIQKRLATVGTNVNPDATPTPTPGMPPTLSGLCGDDDVGDSYIDVGNIFHLDTDGNYRSPVGDLQMGQTATLKLRTCAHDVQTVQALVWKTGAGPNPSYIYTATLVQTDTQYAYWAMQVPAPDVVIDQWYQFQVVDGSLTGYFHPIAGNTGPGVWNPTRIDPSWKLGTVTPPPTDFAVPAWMKDAVIYQIFPDRFRNGDASNDPPPYTDVITIYGPNTCNGYPHGRGSGPACVVDGRSWNDPLLIPSYGLDFYGGDLQGIIDKINEGYFNDLGVNVLYLNPIFSASSNHGYDTNDYYNVRSYFGDNAKFDQLITAANNHGLRIVLDAVFNHAGSDSKYIDGYGLNRWPSDTGACEGASPYRSWFTTGGTGSEYGCTDSWKWKGWYGYETIPEFQETDAVKDFFYRGGSAQSPAGKSVAQYWIDKGIAGWRYDVAQDITLPFFYEMNQSIKHTYASTETLMLGEVTGGCDWGLYQNYVKEGYLDSAMNYCFRDWAVSFANGNAPSSFNNSFTSFRARFPNNAWHAMMNLISSHDSPRALNQLNGDTTRLKLIALLQMTLPGAPSVYYGDEVALPGGGDPDNRRTYPWADTGGSPDTAMYAHFKTVIGLRQAHPALRGGDFKTLLVDDANRLYSYLRWDATESIVVALNNGEAAQSNVVIPITPTLSNGTVLTDVLNGGTYTVTNGNITVGNINSRWGVILVAGPINPPPLVAPISIGISGPLTGSIGSAQSFSALVDPISVTLPITYEWQATDQTPVNHVFNSRSDAATFTWLTTGNKVVIVTATNAGGTVTDTHTITITTLPLAPTAPSAVTLTGSISGTSHTQHTFNAGVDPISVTLPITYVWQATDQASVTHANVNDRADAVDFVWSNSGSKVITVTATNIAGTVTTTHAITITPLSIPIAPRAITLTGPISGTSNTQYTFNASVDPISVTLPITYVWQATDQPIVTHANVNGRADVMDFVWSSSGSKVITVTATNAAGTVTDTHLITITLLTTPIAPSGVSIAGPLNGEIDRYYVFTATVSPISTTLPLSFTWAYDLGTFTDGVVYPNVNGLVQPHAIKWLLAGTHTITVTASNQAGAALGVYHFTVKPTWRVYLPIVVK